MNDTCVTCLATDRNLVSLKESAIFDILECLMVDKGYTNLAISSKVCWECTAKLKNVKQFQDMAFHSLRRLEEYCESEIHNGLTTNSLTSLSLTKIMHIDLPEDDEAPNENISKADDIKPNIKREEMEISDITFIKNDAGLHPTDPLNDVDPQLDGNDKANNKCTDNEVTEESLLKKIKYSGCASLEEDRNLEHIKTQISNSKNPFVLNKCEENLKTRMHKDLCEFNTAHKDELVRHIYKHTGEKPNKFKLTEYKSTRNGHLINRKRRRKSTKPKIYMCDTCEYKTRDHSNFRRHRHTHTCEKPFACVFCEYRTTRKNNLMRHCRIHTGEKPFKCDLCEYKAAHKNALILHIHKHYIPIQDKIPIISEIPIEYTTYI